MAACCWICLSQDGALEHICNCPKDRVVHRHCLGQWQMHSAGRSEEHHCRFCSAPLPNWKASITPLHLKPAAPVVAVNYNGVKYFIKVLPGREGLIKFQKQIQKLAGASDGEELHILCTCKSPGEADQEINFEGFQAMDAAMYCASISAARRQLDAQSKRQAASRPVELPVETI